MVECGNALLKNGYKVRILNTINFKKSMHYNPFAYVHSEKDILKLVTTLMTNTKGEGSGGDPFWEKSERLLLTALIAYLHYEAPVEEQNFATLLEMLNTMQVLEDDEEYQNPVDLLFEELGKKKPNSFAVRQYKLYKLAAGKTAKSILISCGARLAPFDIQELRGLRLAIAAETEEGARLDSAAVKQLGSQDKISARPLYGKPIAFWPSHTLVLFTNFLPKVGSRDDGTWSRLKIAPFKAKLRGAKGEVKDFASYLYDNAGGAVLSWIIEGAQRFIANGFKIEPPEAARAALAEYSRENDWLQDFIEDCCCIGPSHTAGSQELYTMYAMHCQATGAGYKRDAREFRQALTAAGYESRRQNKGVRFYGLGLKSAAAPDV